ncbi:MAG: SMC family ATPase [Candidatus Babeliaceae bacterium]|jgi:exonuclease SbcC
MIPLKISIKNFLSYGYPAQTIDFEPYQLMCLSGKNGHGKSALLDAITWALWGQARKISGTVKADEGLVRLGQNNMSVTLDFICNNTTYRAKREFTLSTNKSYTNVEFGILDASGTYKSLTDKTIRTTQEKIEKIIGLNFETFVNSIFLRQGQSHEFSKKSPKERKDILCSILGLEQFESIKRRILDATKIYTHEKEYLDKTNTRIIQEIEHAPSITASYQTTCDTLAIIITHEHTSNKQLELLDQEKKKLDQEYSQHQLLIAQHASLLKQVHEIKKYISQESTHWRRLHHKKITAQGYSADTLFLLEKEFYALQEQYAQRISLQAQVMHTQQALNKLTTELNTLHMRTIASIENTISGHKLNANTLAQKSTDYQEKYAQLCQQETEYAQKKAILENALKNSVAHQQKLIIEEQQYEKRKNYYHKFTTKLTSLREQVTTQNTQKHSINQQSNCPLCTQELNPLLQQTVLNHFAQQEALSHHHITRLSSILTHLKELLLEQRTRIEALKKEQHNHIAYTTQYTALLEQIALLAEQKKNTHKNIQELLTKIADTQKQLQDAITLTTTTESQYEHTTKNNPDYQKLALAISELEQKITALSFDQVHYEHIKVQYDKANIYRTEYNNLQKELHGQEHRRIAIRASIEQCKMHALELKKLAQLISNSTIQERMTHIEDLCAEHKRTLNKLSEQKNGVLQQKGRLEQQQAIIAKYQEELGINQKRLLELEQQLDNLQVLAQAVGKEGIQALLIENALPELEHDANALLSKLTENQAQIHIESLKDLKNGGIKETLIINISDAMGIRPYELFSGGEAFRIDFALRIALSQLLARRAGTSLQTLIIDEGFGSQDEEGLAHIMDALHKIQDNFSKIIIVSHLASMKDQFPTQFFVHKGPHGSTVNVIHQG